MVRRSTHAPPVSLSTHLLHEKPDHPNAAKFRMPPPPSHGPYPRPHRADPHTQRRQPHAPRGHAAMPANDAGMYAVQRLPNGEHRFLSQGQRPHPNAVVLMVRRHQKGRPVNGHLLYTCDDPTGELGMNINTHMHTHTQARARVHPGTYVAKVKTHSSRSKHRKRKPRHVHVHHHQQPTHTPTHTHTPPQPQPQPQMRVQYTDGLLGYLDVDVPLSSDTDDDDVSLAGDNPYATRYSKSHIITSLYFFKMAPKCIDLGCV